jgi:hypothetical protein
MKTNLLSMALSKKAEMLKSKISFGFLLLFLVFTLLNLKAADEEVIVSYQIPVLISGSQMEIEQLQSIQLQMDLINPEKIISVKFYPSKSGGKPYAETLVRDFRDGRIDVDIIIRTAGNSSLINTNPIQNEDYRIVIGNIEVITVDNISGVTQNNENVGAFRAAFNGMNSNSSSDNSNQNSTSSIVLELLPAQFTRNNDKIKLNASELEQLITVYPNPSIDGLVRVKSKVDGLKANQIQVYNVMGGLVMNQVLNNSMHNEQVLDLTGLTKGVYFIKIITEFGETTKKLNLLK